MIDARFDHALALRADGRVVAWGDNSQGQCVVPSGASNVISVAGGMSHSLALRHDGTVLAWGAGSPGTPGDGQSTVPEPASNVVAIAAGYWHSVALRDDGLIVGWGRGGLRMIEGAGRTVVLGDMAALQEDGTLLGLGYCDRSVAPGISNVTAIADTLALLSDGTVVNWTRNRPLSTPFVRCFAIVPCFSSHIALYEPDPLLPAEPFWFSVAGSASSRYPSLSIHGQPDRSYRMLVSTNLVDWLPMTDLGEITGDSTLEDPTPMGADVRFYRAVTP